MRHTPQRWQPGILPTEDPWLCVPASQSGLPFIDGDCNYFSRKCQEKYLVSI